MEKTSGHALEVDILLKTKGDDLKEKWIRYLDDRAKEILDKFSEFCQSPIYNEKLFKKFLMLVDCGHKLD